MSTIIKSILIPDLFRIVARMLDTTSAIHLRNTCRQFSDLDQNAHSGYLQMIECEKDVNVLRIPIRASWVRSLRPRSIFLKEGAFEHVSHIRGVLTHVQRVRFFYRVNHPIPREWWPSSTTQAEHHLGGSVDWPDHITSLHYALDRDENYSQLFREFPVSLTTLDIWIAQGYVDRETSFTLYRGDTENPPRLDHLVNLTSLTLAYCSRHTRHLPRLPPSLRVLRVGTLCTPILPGRLPASLRELSIRDFMLMGNIEGGALPDSLTHLTVRNVHNNRYVRWTLPNSLRFLRLNVGRTTPRDDFAAFVSRLPDSLEQLHLNQLTPIVTVAKWPAKLRELHVTMYVHVDRDTDSVTRVESSFEFAPLPATFESLHIGLTKHLEWNTSFRPRKNFKLNVYRFTDGQDSIMVDKLDGRTLELHRLLQ